MNNLWKLALCGLASACIVSAAQAELSQTEEVAAPSCQLGRCQWTSHELFEHVVGFQSEPMSAMMEKLTPDAPELWDVYSDTIGNLLLANLYLGGDKEALIKATYDLRFHPEMTYACLYSMTQVAPFSSFEDEAKTIELACLATGMDYAVYMDASGYDADDEAIAEYITVLYQQGLLPEPTIFPHAILPPIRIIRLFDEASLPVSCLDTYSIFAAKECEQTIWCSEEHVAGIEANNQFPGDGPNLADSLARYLTGTQNEEALLTKEQVCMQQALVNQFAGTPFEVSEEEAAIMAQRSVTVTEFTNMQDLLNTANLAAQEDGQQEAMDAVAERIVNSLLEVTSQETFEDVELAVEVDEAEEVLEDAEVDAEELPLVTELEEAELDSEEQTL